MAPASGIGVDRLLGRTIPCECGRTHEIPTRVVASEPGAVARVPEIVRDLTDPARALVVADRRTWRAAGERVEASLRGTTSVDRTVVPDDAHGALHASEELVAQIEAAVPDRYGVYLAVGSGTINDLTKELAHRRGRPYVVVTTAASMNGYTSSIVALLRGGLKTTGTAAPPVAVVADPEVLAAAPFELTLAGLGDLVSKPYSGCDWWLASLIVGEAFCPLPGRILGDAFDQALDVFPRLADRDPEAIGLLSELLILSGLTMTIAGGSSPASGGEHLVSHYWDMVHLRDQRPLQLHGAQVGVASVAMDALYAEVAEVEFDRATFRPDPGQESEHEIAAALGPLAEVVLPEWRAKLARRSARDLDTLRSRQAAVKREIASVLASGRKVRAALAAAGAPMWAAELGITRSELEAALRFGRAIRRRYTVLDVAAELGLLEGFAATYPDREKGVVAQ